MSRRYDPAELEPRWQSRWEEARLFKTDDSDRSRPKYYILDMFPYPSGAGLHVGHPEGYTATDIMSRYKRMRGFNVLHPMGWDAFGLPAENRAIETGIHPAISTRQNIATFKRQIKRLGLSYDWDREISTVDPHYYRWTQWIFLKLFEKGLAYQAEIPVNWCPALGTVLANEEITPDGKSERGHHDVVRLPMRQWMLRITAYADRLIDDLEGLDWPESVKEMQRNWIGRSEGAQIQFNVPALDASFEVFTTRPDTLFGCTYCVLAPEHPLVARLTTPEQKTDVERYVEAARHKSDLSRTSLDKEKTGVFTGGYAVNPANGQAVPVWIGDYVLGSYGTGAIMSVPAHDERDHAFALRYGLPIVEVVQGGQVPVSEAAFTGEGVSVSCGEFSGLSTAETKKKITSWLESRGMGKRTINYKLRDWVFSRQRYWGEPFPLIHVGDEVRPVPEGDLPVTLPDVERYQPTGTGDSPLAAIESWVNTTDPMTGEPARRETNTMPQWAGSCWYYLRYLDPHNDEKIFGQDIEQYWMPVDLYVGGVEHAVLHLLYARFWHKVLFDLGVVSTREPFQKLVNQGMILGSDGEKMSKSRGNVVNPDEVVAEHGADALRLYEMFMGPLEQVKPWNAAGVSGTARFLHRAWRLVDSWLESGGEEPSADNLRTLRHQTIKKVTEDIDAMRFNTAISQLMTYLNALYKEQRARREDLELFTVLLSPFAPHLAEELWSLLGHSDFIQKQTWPTWVEEYTREAHLTLTVAVNGKHRGSVELAPGTPEAEVVEITRTLDNVARHLEGKVVVKTIFVQDKMINFVAK